MPDLVQVLGVAAIRSEAELKQDWRITRKFETSELHRCTEIEVVSAYKADDGTIEMVVAPARDTACARCWRHAVQIEGKELCDRCIQVLHA